MDVIIWAIILGAVFYINKKSNEVEVTGEISLPLSRNYKRDTEDKYIEYLRTRV